MQEIPSICCSLTEERENLKYIRTKIKYFFALQKQMSGLFADTLEHRKGLIETESTMVPASLYSSLTFLIEYPGPSRDAASERAEPCT